MEAHNRDKLHYMGYVIVSPQESSTVMVMSDGPSIGPENNGEVMEVTLFLSTVTSLNTFAPNNWPLASYADASTLFFCELGQA